MANSFHCCATCRHFRSERQGNNRKLVYYCHRLQYDTQPTYQFNCWDPTEKVLKLMEKRKRKEAGNQ
ncbi:hypothetical protein [Bacillus seohaeanensis]|uniref:Uncharacterized protein n=1 Tax=Bacillus seohaeanensis TaxID=284580 RepID=A0ABW5RPK8_9BACI